mmetsp:Transcript_25300/g.22417  ORF Transcript_25300/g.22417 Transcript_25300/m.22417 type:complete len:86 (+) Transcript_25300:214-471(+)
MNCRISDLGIGPMYRLKFFKFDLRMPSLDLKIFPMSELVLNHQLKDVQIIKSESIKQHFYTVFLANNSHDSVVYISGMNYTDPNY